MAFRCGCIFCEMLDLAVKKRRKSQSSENVSHSKCVRHFAYIINQRKPKKKKHEMKKEMEEWNKLSGVYFRFNDLEITPQNRTTNYLAIICRTFAWHWQIGERVWKLINFHKVSHTQRARAHTHIHKIVKNCDVMHMSEQIAAATSATKMHSILCWAISIWVFEGTHYKLDFFYFFFI